MQTSGTQLWWQLCFLIVCLAENVSSLWVVTLLHVREFSFCGFSAFGISLAKNTR